ncbi:MAG: YihY/virulence factor BrkB family protein [Acidobacteria bacterium]|nr:YihY/virulence factor BrkB family protein [Acidobacteriota bacterium]
MAQTLVPAQRVSLFRIRAKLLYDAWLYVFDRDATILISSISFSFLLSVFPFIVLVLTLASYLGWGELRDTIFEALRSFFPIAQDFIVRNLRIYTLTLGQLHVVSFVLLAWSGAAFFFALEAGLDSAYRVPKYRHFVLSNLLGTAMAIFFGMVSSFFIVLLRAEATVSSWVMPLELARSVLAYLFHFILSVALTVLLFFGVYYFLPNRPRSFQKVVPEVLFASVLWMVSNLIFKLLAPSWSLQNIYGPFYISVTLLMWAYLFGCIVLATARLSEAGFFKPRSEAQ